MIPNPMPITGYVRLSQLIGNSKKDPPIPGIFPVSKSTIWSWVKSGRFPRPLKLSPGVTVWKIEDIREHIKSVKGYCR